MSALADEARALVQPLGAPAAAAKACDEFHFGMVVVDAAMVLHFEAQPLRAAFEFQCAGRPRRWMPGREDPLDVSAFVGRIARAHQRQRVVRPLVLAHSARAMMIFCTSDVPS